ncbi:methylmalonyl-CoA mutase family protein, partial [Kribbia dieselivorans]|uniref:methylmalonyl-CoA mutase family protein n=1 Tax=Kribbia dieselivorans TaxID=331526 RepID=UPI000AF1DEDA
MTPESSTMPLAEGFAPVSHEQWQDLVAKVINRGRPADKQLDGPASEARLRTTTVENIEIDPLYLADEADQPLGHPGVMPFTRGSGFRPAQTPWGVRALHDDPEVATTAKAVLTDLENGVTSLWFEVGDHAVKASDLAAAMEHVILDLAPVSVTSATDQAAAADALRAVWRDRGIAGH